MPRRATARGAQRTSLDGARADVLVCGASFAGLAAARELAGRGHDVLVVDRYEIGERATSACAIPTPWLRALGLEAAARQELPAMRFTTPHGSVRYRLPWSWTAFDYRELCLLLWAQCAPARFATATIRGRAGRDGADLLVATDRGVLRAPLVVDACGWRRVLGDPHVQPPHAPVSRGLEVHPAVAEDAPAPDELHCWVDRSLARRGYGWSVPAGAERRVGVGSYEPRDQVKEPTKELARRQRVDAVRYQGGWFPHRLRSATDGEVLFAGDSAGHCFPLSGEGIRTALHFGAAAGRELAAVLAGERDRAAACARYAAFHERHRPAFERALAPAAARPRGPAAAAHARAARPGPPARGRPDVPLVPATGPAAVRRRCPRSGSPRGCAGPSPSRGASTGAGARRRASRRSCRPAGRGSCRPAIPAAVSRRPSRPATP